MNIKSTIARAYFTLPYADFNVVTVLNPRIAMEETDEINKQICDKIAKKMQIPMEDDFYGNVLHDLARMRPTERVRALANVAIEQGVDKDLRSSSKLETPLHVAAAFGNVWMVQFLIAKNAELLHRDVCGRTPIEVAIDARCWQCSEALMESMYGDRCDAVMSKDIGKSLLKLAKWPECNELLMKLISKGISLRAVDDNGNNLLHIATHSHNDELLTLINDRSKTHQDLSLALRGLLSGRNSEGLTPLELNGNARDEQCDRVLVSMLNNVMHSKEPRWGENLQNSPSGINQI